MLMAIVGVACTKTREVHLQPVAAERGGTYFKDVRGLPYPSEFADRFNYAEAEVVINFQKRSPKWFDGDLRATGLKPNFCYQVKLEGKPGHIWSIVQHHTKWYD